MRIPVLTGTRVTVVRLPDDVVAIAAPPALDPIVDVATAAAQAVRHPLAGAPLDRLVRRGGRVTIVVEPPALPVPGSVRDPRQEALAGVIDELTALGVPPRNHTLLAAAGLERRPGRHELERLLRPGRARDFTGAVAVHDAESRELTTIGDGPDGPLRIHPALVEADAVIVVGAAESVVHGGPSTLARAADAQTARRLAGEWSLLEVRGAAWDAALAVESALEAQVPVIGVSLVLDHPRLTGPFRGWPAAEARDRVARSKLRAVHGLLPGPLRVPMLQQLDRELNAVSVLAGRPSVAHAEALLRGSAMRGARVPARLQTIVVPLPWKALHRPREALNPITAAAAAAHALRLWRDRPPLLDGGTVVVPHPFGGAVGQGGEAPYLPLLSALRAGAEGRKLAAVERLARTDARALERYRAGRAVHPLLAFADWEGARTALDRAGRVIVAGCRDASAARALGFVPSHNLQTALAMAEGVAETDGPIGLLVAPPYPPLLPG